MVIELEDIFQNNGYSEKDFRIDTGVMLFQRKVVTLTRAVKISGVTKEAFNKILAERNVSVSVTPKPLTRAETMLNNLSPDDPLRKAIKPIRENVTLDDIKRENNYKKTNWESLRQLAHDLAIEEPIELLLQQLKE